MIDRVDDWVRGNDVATKAPNRVMAVDFGGTNIRAAVVSADGTLAHRLSEPTCAEDGPEAVIGRIAALIGKVADEANLPADVPVGVAAPGPLSSRTGTVYSAPNLPGWHHVPLGSMLAERTGREVIIGNDANCAALGEARFGAGVGEQDLIYLGLGTGVGGGVISGGQLIDGAQGLGGELGHMTVAMNGPRCTCGSIGCLEAFTSGWAIGREGMLVAGTADGEAIRRAAGDGPVTAHSVADAARAADPAALAILTRAGDALGAAIGALINIFNPDLIVIGGGLAELGDLLLGPARATIPSFSFRAQREHARVIPAALGDDAGLFGAAALVFSRQQSAVSRQQ